MNRFRPVHAAEHAVNAAKALRLGHGGVVRMAGQAHLVLLRHGHDALHEIADALPGLLRAHRPGFGRRVPVGRLLVIESAVSGAAAARGGFRAHYAENRHVVFQQPDARLRCVADHLADVVDLAVALRALAQHDVGALGPGNVGGAERQRHGLQLEAERFHVLAAARERFHRPVLVQLGRGQLAANVIHSQRRHHFQDVVAVAVLRAEFEVGLAAGRRLGSLSLRAGRRQRTGGGVEEFSAMHANSLADCGQTVTVVAQAVPPAALVMAKRPEFMRY